MLSWLTTDWLLAELDAREAAHVGELPHGAEVVRSDSARDVRAATDQHVPGEHHVVGEDDVGLGGHVRRLGADFLVMARHEVDHALELDRQLAIGIGRADGEGLEELAWGFGAHVSRPANFVRSRRCLAQGVRGIKGAILRSVGATYSILLFEHRIADVSRPK